MSTGHFGPVNEKRNSVCSNVPQTVKPGSTKATVSLLDIFQSDLLLQEFENILTIKRGKMLSALKVDQIYEKIHHVEKIVDECTLQGRGLNLAQL